MGSVDNQSTTLEDKHLEEEAERAFDEVIKRGVGQPKESRYGSDRQDDSEDEFDAVFDEVALSSNYTDPGGTKSEKIENNGTSQSANYKSLNVSNNSKPSEMDNDYESNAKKPVESVAESGTFTKSDCDNTHRQVPPLPSFAIELMAQKSSGSLSPTIQELTRQESSSSSDKGWTSDPDNSPKKLKKQQPLKEAKEEWEQVETVTAGESSGASRSPMVTFSEALFHFQSANLDEFAAHIKPAIKHSGFGALWNALAGPPRIIDSLKQERDLIFTLGLCPLDNHEPMHLMILQTIYKKLTATNLDCPRYGSHWEIIGFQGEDPSTDLRGCGMLGLVNALYFTSDIKTHSLAIDIYRLSQDEIQNFPFCVMGINITRITLQIFREGKLNKECNRRRQVFEIFHELYSSIFYEIYRIWKTQHKTISDSGFVLNDVETAAKKKPIDFVRNIQRVLTDRKKVVLPDPAPSIQKDGAARVDKVDHFSGVCDIGSNEEEDVHLV